VSGYGYLGPEGTFTETALAAALAAAGVGADLPRVPYPTVPAVLDAVRSGEVDEPRVLRGARTHVRHPSDRAPAATLARCRSTPT